MSRNQDESEDVSGPGSEHSGERDHVRGPNESIGKADPSDEPVEYPISDELDLHTFRPRDIPDVVDSYLEAAQEAGLRGVRIVHGKGTGFQRERVREILGAHPLVESFGEAPGHRGHWGATMVRIVPRDALDGEE
jgi:dsDNA-specific endonuclease/ATPase MutS2